MELTGIDPASSHKLSARSTIWATAPFFGGDTRIWTRDLSDCSRLLYRWAISPKIVKVICLVISYQAHNFKVPPAGLEPAIFRLEVWRAIQLRHGGGDYQLGEAS